MAEVILQERVTLLDALLGGIQTFRNGCNFRLRFMADKSVWLEYGCYGVLVNLATGKERLLMLFLDGDSGRGKGKLKRLPVSEPERMELLKMHDLCKCCGGHMHEVPKSPALGPDKP